MIIHDQIRLRPIEREDLPRFVQWFNDPEVTKGLVLTTGFSLAEEESWFEAMLKRPPEEHPLAIDVHQDDTWIHIGSCGFNKIDWRNRKGELGIAIGNKAFWDRGFGTQIMRMLLELGFGTYNLERVFLRVYANNPRAIRTYEKVGFVLEGRLRRARYYQGQYYDEIIMSVLRSEWFSRKEQ